MMDKTFPLLATLTTLLWLPPPTSSSCPENNPPYWEGPPTVEQVTLTSVRVSWQEVLVRPECADNIVVKHFPSDDKDNQHMSPHLPVSDNSFIVQDLQFGKAYTYLVIAREEKGWGVSTGSSSYANFTTYVNNDAGPSVVDESESAVKVFTITDPVVKYTEYKGMVLASKIVFLPLKIHSSKVTNDIESALQATTNTRKELLRELRIQAVLMGANTIVGFRMETNSIIERYMEIVVYGTAVYFQ
eukprot:GFUD01044576.1.p1 GENE.GFUD01044576.1~~GFUD01044576.1.p1  ORF type:complete len:244 (+),score=68.62 GFUD01044576.1:97-828(+)